MTYPAVSRRATSLLIAGTLVVAPLFIQQASAVSPSAKEGDKCAKVGVKTRSRSGMNLTCARVGKTKILKWKRFAKRPTKSMVTTVPTVTTTSQISIKSFTFTVVGNVKSTDAVSVTNRDGFTHTVTSDTGVFDVTVEGGATVSLPSLNPGVYAFHCAIHTSMHGTLTVT